MAPKVAYGTLIKQCSFFNSLQNIYTRGEIIISLEATHLASAFPYYWLSKV